MRLNLPLLLMLSGIGLMLTSGIPAVFEFMSMQGFPSNPTSSLFPSHWFIMIYGFFGALIGNEILVALSVEWSGKIANNNLIISFTALTIIASLSSFFVSILFSMFLEIISISILLLYSQTYLNYSKIGLKPSTYNWLLLFSLIITIIILSFQIGLGYVIPYVNLFFPIGVIFAVMSRDLALVTRAKINDSEIALAFIFLTLGIISYSSFYGEALLFLAWLLSFHSSKLYKFKGRKYPILHLTTAWIFFLTSIIFYANYDIFIHSIAVGFLFNTVFGVDVVLMDMFVNAFGKVSVKPSYIPYILMNSGLMMRIIYDLGVNYSFLILSAPLQGFGILSFFILTLRQVLLKNKV
ncbi:nitric oxide response protein [Acidianus manzaensis]|uniref:Nitric oxide response protein n=1 Tax=Acidianus manzaensis TaxID=282676 RepID=A0A1W6K334_9CREN|nr:nitric oxide response protein [Acidianus manzaensis]ARM76895.1 nitric oxide response protein [Acidianus manzaensis]